MYTDFTSFSFFKNLGEFWGSTVFSSDVSLSFLSLSPCLVTLRVKGISHSSSNRARPDWAYEFPDQTGPDTQIFWTGPAGPNWIQSYIFKHFTYQVQVINTHKIRFLTTNLASKVPRPKKSWKKFEKNLTFFSVFKSRCPGRKTICFLTVRILKIWQTFRTDVMSGRALSSKQGH